MFEIFRRSGVVGIHDRNPFAGSLVESGIQSGRFATICLFNQTDIRKPRRIIPQNLSGTVGRAVVDGNDFKVAEDLCLKRIQSLRQILFRVVDRKENGYGGS